MRKIRVLVLLRYLAAQGGLQKVVNSYYERFDLSKFDIDFLVLDHEDPIFEQSVMEAGHNIFHVKGIRERDILLLAREAKKFFEAHHDYDILHCHQTNFDFIFLYYAKRLRIPVRVLHSHSTRADISPLQLWLERFGGKRFATHRMGCSIDAGEFLFGDKVESNAFFLVNNAFEIERFGFNGDDRIAARNKYGIPEDTVVVGQVGRLSSEKRHDVALRALQQLKAGGLDFRFVIVGDGDLRSEIERTIVDLGLSDRVVMTGAVDAVAPILSALDVYLMPSRFEGVPVALLEALANGCPAVISDVINSVIEDEGLIRVPVDADSEEWAEGVQKAIGVGRRDRKSQLEAAGYGIVSQVKALSDIYCELADIQG